jgi:hypothetical protein
MAIQYGVVVENEDKTMTGKMKVIKIGFEGKNVRKEHKSYSASLGNGGTAQAGMATNHAPDIGTLVTLMDDMLTSGPSGSAFNFIGSVVQNVPKFSGLSGGGSIMSQFQEFFEKEQGMNLPPDSKDDTKEGAKVRKTQEKGKFTYKKMEGMPTHASLPNTMGMALPELKNISTAVDSFSANISGALQGAMPGFNLGSISDVLKTIEAEIMDKLPEDLGVAFSSMQNFTRSVSTSPGSGFTSGLNVDLNTLLDSARDILSKAESIEDLTTGLQRLGSDTSLMGLDKLAKGTLEVDGPFGKISLSVGPDGSIEFDIPDVIQKLMDSFGSMLGSFSDLPGANGTDSLFGKMSESLNAMHSRLPPEIEKARKEAIEKLAKSPQSKRLNSYFSKFLKGGKVGT